MDDYIKRDMEETFMFVSERFSGILLTGPRQVGKSTMLRHLKEDEREEVTLDDVEERELAKSQPGSFLSRHRLPIIIDEVQYAPELFSYIKMAIDNGAPHGSFWLTGSQNIRLMKFAGESMAGRVALLEMSGLSQNEIYSKKENTVFSMDKEKIIQRTKERTPATEDEIYERIYRGSLPEFIKRGTSSERERDFYVKAYVNMCLSKDIQEEIPGVNTSQFYDFMKSAACLIGQTLNVHSLARAVEISDDTAKRWLTVLEKTGIIFYLTPYSNNLLKRTVKMKKLYFFDTGLAAYLTHQQSPRTLKESTYSGAILENYVVSEIRKTYTNYGTDPYMYYYRDTSNREIDLIIEEDGKLHPIEIKKTAQPTRSMISNFSVLEKSTVPMGNGLIICMGKQLSAVDENTLTIPVWAI